MFHHEPISAGLAAKIVHMPSHPGGEPLFRKKIGSALGVPDELGNFAVSGLVPAPGPSAFYQIGQELVKRDGKKEEDKESYHGSSRNLNPSCPGILLRPPGQVGNPSNSKIRSSRFWDNPAGRGGHGPDTLAALPPSSPRASKSSATLFPRTECRSAGAIS
jgi:hypothetical protein